MGYVLQSTPHETFHGYDAVSRIPCLFGFGLQADDRSSIPQVAHDRRQQCVAMVIVQDHGNAVAHRGYQ